MTNSKILRVRLTASQFERLRSDAESFGKKTISEYVRAVLLQDDLNFKKLLIDIHRKISKIRA